MKKTFGLIAIIFTFAACSGSKDTTTMSPEEHFNYAMELYNNEDYEQVVSEFQTILLQYPGSPVTDDAQYYLGMTYFKREQYLLGAFEFSKLIRDIPTSTFVADAQFMLAESYYQLSPPYQLDQAYTKKAIEEFQAFIDVFPTNPKSEEAASKITELNNKLAEKLYNSAVIYEKMEYYFAAINYYGKVVEIFHDTRFGAPALYKKIQIELLKNKTADVLRDTADFMSRYSNHEFAADVKKIQDSILN
jgi:outer membrane protein assembly factor BamD